MVVGGVGIGTVGEVHSHSHSSPLNKYFRIS